MSTNGADDLSRYGIPTSGGDQAPASTVVTVVGKTKTCAGLRLKEWLFLAVSIVNILATVSLTIYRMYRIYEKEDQDSADFTFALLILISSVFCFFYAIHGVLREREFEIYALIGAVLIVLVYCVVEYIVNVKGRDGVKLGRMIAACVFAPLNIFLAVLVARRFGWLEFKIVGASEALQVMYRQAALFYTLLKFDLQVSISFLILVLSNGTEVDTLEQVTLGVGVPYTVLWLAIGVLMVRREIKWLSIVFGVLSVASPVYIIYKTITIFIELDPQVKEGNYLVISSLFAGALGLIVRAVLVFELVIVVRNFGKGLKEKAFDAPVSERTSLLTGRRTDQE